MGLNSCDGMEVDHINHNGLDNQKKNLRICSHAENLRNRLPKKISTSKYLGVQFKTFKRKYKNSIYVSKHWQAQINGKYLGLFKDEKTAAQAYNIAAQKLYGEFANLNVIPE